MSRDTPASDDRRLVPYQLDLAKTYPNDPETQAALRAFPGMAVAVAMGQCVTLLQLADADHDNRFGKYLYARSRVSTRKR